MGASANLSEREQSTGSSMVAASLELLLPALTQTFIRINEAYNKRVGEAKKAAETETVAGSGQEGGEGVCSVDRGAVARSHTGTGWTGLHANSATPWIHDTKFLHGRMGMLVFAHLCAHRHKEKRDSLTRDQPSMLEKGH